MIYSDRPKMLFAQEMYVSFTTTVISTDMFKGLDGNAHQFSPLLSTHAIPATASSSTPLCVKNGCASSHLCRRNRAIPCSSSFSTIPTTGSSIFASKYPVLFSGMSDESSISCIAAVITKMTYDYDMAPEGDEFVALAEKSADTFSQAAAPGAWLVDIIPWCTFNPSEEIPNLYSFLHSAIHPLVVPRRRLQTHRSRMESHQRLSPRQTIQHCQRTNGSRHPRRIRNLTTPHIARR